MHTDHDTRGRQGLGQAVLQALSYLERVVDQARDGGTRTLPSVDRLASTAGVSRMTMWRAVQHLCGEGLLRSGRGRPIELCIQGYPDVRSSDARETGRRSRWRTMSGVLAREIAEGRYAAGSALPTIKELRARYGGCYRTLARVLADLCARGYLTVSGRKYLVRPTAISRGYKPYIVLVAFGDRGRLNLVSSRTQDQVRALEAVCRSHELDLVTVTGDIIESQASTARSWGGTLKRIRRRPPLGVVLWTMAFWEQRILSALDFMKQLGVPAAVLIEALNTRGLLRAYGRLRVKPFVMAITPTCGQAMGRYLLGLGHRRVAYVGSGDNPSPRLRGLCDAFEHAGVPGGVKQYAIPPASDYLSAYESDELLRRAPSALAATGQADERSAELIGEALDTLLAHSAWVLQRPAGAIDYDRTIERILADESVTALVGDNDEVAIELLTRLVERGVAIPGRLSVAGFDDSITALTFGLTSYNFSGEAVAKAMVAHILNPQPVAGSSEIRGVVVERRTTGAARQV